MTRTVSASRGAMFVVGMRWADRFIGFISTIILARLLVPADFGIIAMASIVVGLIDVLLDVGVNIALIQNKHATQDDYNTAWTVRLLQAIVAAAVVLAVSVPAADYFRDPRVALVIQVLSLSLILSACENIGMVTFQKKREFGVEFRFFFTRRVSSFVITVLAAWYLHSYWALVIGTLAGRSIGVLLSYAMHPMRPRVSFARVKPMLAVSTWNLLRGVAGFLSENLHRFLVGGRTTAAVMGSYSIAGDIAAMPSTELLAPLSRVLFPLFVEVGDNLTKLKRAFLLALGVQSLLGIPAATGLAIVASEAVRVLLGEKWMSAVPFVQILAFVNIVGALGTSSGLVLMARGRMKLLAFNAWMSVTFFALLAIGILPQAGPDTIALLRLTVASASLATLALLVKHELPSVRWRELAAAIWRPCLAAGVMVIAVLAVATPVRWPIAELLFKVGVGAFVYAAVLLGSWRLAGCPDGAESYLLEKTRLEAMVRRILRIRRLP